MTPSILAMAGGDARVLLCKTTLLVRVYLRLHSNPMMLARLLALSAPLAAAVVVVDVGNVTNPAVSRRWMGCHSDYGFAQTPQGFGANMLYGASFGPGTEGTPPWTTRIGASAGGGASVTVAQATSFAGKSSMALNGGDGAGDVALVSRGIGGSGLFLRAGKPYSFEA